LLASAPRPGEAPAAAARRFDPVAIVVLPEARPEPAERAAPTPTRRRQAITPRPTLPRVAAPAQTPPPTVAEAATPSPPASRPLVLDEPTLHQARTAARRGGVGALAESAGVPLATARSPAEQRADGVQRAVRPDCRVAHAGKGLFAVPFLLRDAMADDGCKW
jgi:hypothetical protein